MLLYCLYKPQTKGNDNMKQIIIATILVLAITAFAQETGHCESMYQSLTKVIPTQTTTICRVTGLGEERNDISGMFFNFDIKGRQYQAVFVYGSNYTEMLYALPSDLIVNEIKCIESPYFRKIKSRMTSAQIVNKMLSYKKCEDGFEKRHIPTVTGKWMTE